MTREGEIAVCVCMCVCMCADMPPHLHTARVAAQAADVAKELILISEQVRGAGCRVQEPIARGAASRRCVSPRCTPPESLAALKVALVARCVVARKPWVHTWGGGIGVTSPN